MKTTPWIRKLALPAVIVLGLIVTLIWDAWALGLMRQIGFAELKSRFEPAAWWRALWVYGTLWIWGPISAALAIQAATRRDPAIRARAIVMALAPLAAAALGGGLADGLKPFLCRMRPEHAGPGETYAFVEFLKNFPRGSGLGLPSSHAAVAVGGALALGRLFPNLAWLALALAVGTCLSRVLAGAHYPSDVYVGAWVGYASAGIVASALGRPNHQTPTSPPQSPAPPC